MARVAFQLTIRPGCIEAYDESHRHVWPEMLQALKSVGISNYSIFRRDRLLVLVLEVDDFERAWAKLDRNPVNLRWQKEMAPLFEPLAGLEPDERFAMMREVFFLE
jgi:L-rhamnose mutarotase